ncbi:MAG: hypothetical protein ACHQ50_15595 [Fimbriimonadales bacterium]
MIAVAVAALLPGWIVWRIRYPGRPFDPVAWQDPVRVQQGVRLGMAERIVAWGTLGGKTRQHVIKLLGKRSDEGYFREWDLVYWLGPERGFISIDSERLVVRLGRDDRVSECRIVRD